MSEPPVTIREACSTDAERVAALLRDLGYSETVAFARATLRALTDSDADDVFVAEADGNVVGVLHLHVAQLFQRAARTGRVMALVVDELIGQQDIVIKSLGRRLRDVPGIAGAAELGNQQTILVIDMVELLDEMVRGTRATDVSDGPR